MVNNSDSDRREGEQAGTESSEEREGRERDGREDVTRDPGSADQSQQNILQWNPPRDAFAHPFHEGHVFEPLESHSQPPDQPAEVHSETFPLSNCLSLNLVWFHNRGTFIRRLSQSSSDYHVRKW
jgi:hypothetical protein